MNESGSTRDGESGIREQLLSGGLAVLLVTSLLSGGVLLATQSGPAEATSVLTTEFDNQLDNKDLPAQPAGVTIGNGKVFIALQTTDEIIVLDESLTQLNKYSVSGDGILRDVEYKDGHLFALFDGPQVKEISTDGATTYNTFTPPVSAGDNLLWDGANNRWLMNTRGSSTVYSVSEDFSTKQDTISLSKSIYQLEKTPTDGYYYATTGGETLHKFNSSFGFIKSISITPNAWGIAHSDSEWYLTESTPDSVKVYESAYSEPTPTATQTATPEPPEISENLTLDVTRNLLRPNESTEYSVAYRNGSVQKDVTAEATVTSSNTTLLTVDQTAAELVATTDENLSGRVTVTVEYNNLTTRQNVSVAEPTVKNWEIIPGVWRLTAVASDDTFFALFIAVFFAVAAGRLISAFAGLGVGQMVLTIGWLGGYVSFGIAAVGLFSALFIGLNLAARTQFIGPSGRI